MDYSLSERAELERERELEGERLDSERERADPEAERLDPEREARGLLVAVGDLDLLREASRFSEDFLDPDLLFSSRLERLRSSRERLRSRPCKERDLLRSRQRRTRI